MIATGASFGAFHAMSIAMRNPTLFHRVIGMSGMYDIKGMVGGYSDDLVYASNPFDFVRARVGASAAGRVPAAGHHPSDWRGDPIVSGQPGVLGDPVEQGIGNALTSLGRACA